MMTTITQSEIDAYRRKFPDHFLVFRVTPIRHVIWHPNERAYRSVAPAEADVAILRAAGEGVPVLVGEPIGDQAGIGGTTR